MKPLVAVSPSVNMNEDEIMLKRAYFSAVFNAGGIPMATDLSGANEIIKNDLRISRFFSVFEDTEKYTEE